MATTSYMKPDEVKRAVTFIYGKEAGGQRALAAAIGKHELTVSRYVRGVAPVGETEAILIRLLVERKRLKSWQLSEEQLAALD